MTLTKRKIAKNISIATNISSTESREFIDSFLRILKEKTKTNNIKISNFGSFYYKYTPRRHGRNPKSGTIHIIKPFNRFVFKASSALKKFLNWYNDYNDIN